MSRIGLDILQLPPALIVKSLHQIWIPVKSLWGRDIFHSVVFQKTIGIPKRAQTGFGGDASSREENNGGRWGNGHDAPHVGQIRMRIE